MKKELKTITIALGQGCRSNEYVRVTMTWGDFVVRYCQHREVDMSMAEYEKLDDAERARVKDVEAYVGGTFRDDIRRLANLEKRTLLTLDLDRGVYDPKELLEYIHTRRGCAVAMYTSFSHREGRPRCRVCIPLARAMGGDEYKEFAARFIEDCGLSEYADECSVRPAQLFYRASCLKDAPRWSGHIDGDALGERRVKSRERRVESGEPRAESGERRVESGEDADADDDYKTYKTYKTYNAGTRVEDPREKGGLIGAFCRVYYPIQRAIDTYLSGVYQKCDRGRYRYIGSKSEPGLIIKDGGLLAYSNHTNSDPAANGHCHNAFDLVMIHLCGGDYWRMANLCKQDAEVLKVILPDLAESGEWRAESEERRAESGEWRVESGEWRAESGEDAADDDAGDDDKTYKTEDDERSDLRAMAEVVREDAAKRKISAVAERELFKDSGVLRLDKYDRPKSDPYNSRMILGNDPELRGILFYDTFADEVQVTSRAPWFAMTHPDERGAAKWSDADDAALEQFVAECYEYKGSMESAVLMTARERQQHPVREYLRSLRWDGEKRLERMMIDIYRSEDTPAIREMTVLLMMGAVARVIDPGVKFDYVTILRGPQGGGKSAFVSVMFSPWNVENFAIVAGKDSASGLRGRWGLELAELAGMKRAELEVVKAFITQQEDRYRPAYGRNEVSRKRQCIFIGTTNETHFLVDEANRRYMILDVNTTEADGYKVHQLLAARKDQLWAEAYALYMAEWRGRPLILSEGAQREQRRINAEAHVSKEDPILADLEEYLSFPLPHDWGSYSKDDRRVYYERGTLAADAKWYYRQEFSVKAFLWERYGLGSLSEARSRDRKQWGGDVPKRIVSYLKEIGGWSETGKKKRTLYGVTTVYERTENPYITDDVNDDEL